MIQIQESGCGSPESRFSQKNSVWSRIVQGCKLIQTTLWIQESGYWHLLSFAVLHCNGCGKCLALVHVTESRIMQSSLAGSP